MIHIISDIHGCFYTLEKLINKVREKDDSPQFVFVGDYVDRGVYSKECVEYVIQLQSEGAVCLRGNHDDIIDWMCNTECETNLELMTGAVPNLMTIGMWWFQNGLLSTVKSYSSTIHNVPLDVVLSAFVSSVPKEHKEFFRGLKMYWENNTHFACHAYLNPTEELPRDLKFLPMNANHDMLWSRFPSKGAEGVEGPFPVWDKIGVFGHTPVGSYGAIAPIRHGNLRLIDTAAFSGECMTAYCCEQDDWILQATDLRDIKE